MDLTEAEDIKISPYVMHGQLDIVIVPGRIRTVQIDHKRKALLPCWSRLKKPVGKPGTF